MKKFMLGVCMIVLVLITAACGGNKEGGDSAGGATLKAIKSKGVIQIAMEGAYPPYNFINESNQLEGFDVDIAQEIAKRLDVKAELLPIPWDSMIPALTGKKFDIIVSDMAITEERKKKVDFSNPYFTTGNQLFVPQDSAIKVPEDMKGKKIGVTISTTAAEMVTEHEADVKLYKNDFLAFEDLINGRLDGVSTDQGVGAKIILERNYTLLAVDGLLNTEEAGITIRKEDTDLREEINKIIADMQNDGTYEEISKKWFGKDIR
ncbi:transporter substrate-binding domain-containing protein [Bacillus sp. FJAT-29790]|uniref:transporter substrate-binding domain-containing protein n=1 Tax=Bacillus sp. FJAT-29790 TaxID=1895002 RepID=UPI001C225FA3|nr:transporter substrate-binding domain-containing protein [Bacillus sp. FJAT-29790]MBU8877533.1 transporter substrate-binding domain-containing protein [Bacillus sp. FJAT-29790]